MRGMRFVALACIVGLAGCGGGGGGSTADPYETYLRNNPDPSLVISRDDAQARALLGCKMNAAPGTIDAVLHDAYKELCR